MKRLQLLVSLFVLASPALANEKPVALEAGEFDGTTAAAVGQFMAYRHYAGVPVDDALAAAWIERWVDDLDPLHMIFLAKDVQAFRSQADAFDDDLMALPAKLDRMFEVYEVYRTRVGERTTEALELLEGELPLEDQGTWNYDRTEAPWPETPEQAKALWKKRIIEQLIAGELQGANPEDRIEMLRKRYTRMRTEVFRNESMDVLESWLTAFTRSFDPHSAYLKPATRDNFDIEMANAVTGIGATLQVDGEYTTVVNIIPGGPADRDGRLKKGDRILAVAQGDGVPEDVVDLRIDKVVKHIRGQKGTEVRLTIVPAEAPDMGHTKIIDLIRDRVEIAESDAEGEVFDIRGHKVGWIGVPGFYSDPRARKGAASDVAAILNEHKSNGVETVVLDLRDNGGGSLREAIDMAGLFIKSGPVVQVRDGADQIEVLRDTDARQQWDGPVIVLTSPASASASEIVAGAIQDYGRGLVVGSKTTHGKGTVQQVIGLNEPVQSLSGKRSDDDVAGALKWTVQKFYRVTGASTQIRGVESDIVLPSPWDGLDVYEADLENALKWDEIAPSRYKPVDDLSAVVPKLQARSAERVLNSEDFGKMREAIKEREALAEEDTVVLDLSDRKAEYEARNARADELELGEDADPIKDEALQLAVDLLEVMDA